MVTLQAARTRYCHTELFSGNTHKPILTLHLQKRERWEQQSTQMASKQQGYRKDNLAKNRKQTTVYESH